MYSLEIRQVKSGGCSYHVMLNGVEVAGGFRPDEHHATASGREDMRLCRQFSVGWKD